MLTISYFPRSAHETADRNEQDDERSEIAANDLTLQSPPKMASISDVIEEILIAMDEDM